MLHTVNKSPFEHTRAGDLPEVRPAGQRGAADRGWRVRGGQGHGRLAKQVQEALKTVSIYALKPDVEARGMQNRVMDGVRLVDYGGFVDLVAEHNAVQSWL